MARGNEAPESTGKTVSIAPLDNVYAYLMFSIPLENAKNPGKFSWNKMMAVFLVALTFLLQAILLFAIFNEVVTGDIVWRQSIMGKQPGLELLSDPGNGCNTGGSMCTVKNDTFSCAPPSVQLTGRWDELDTNGDGIWTRAEVEASRGVLKCKYAVDPVLVYDVFVKFLLAREKLIWIHPELRAGREIRKPYFTYAAGDLIMCGYRNAAMCANVLMRGNFDAPLRYGTAPRVGNTIDSALEYCYGLLQEGGTCERTLPSTYAVWKKASEEQCRGADFDKAVYTHPKTGAIKSMLTVDYAARKAYSMVASSILFFVYKTIIVGMFLLAMFREVKEIWMYFTWCMRYPSAKEFGGKAVAVQVDAETEEVKYTIQAVTPAHRATVAFLTVARLFMILVLTIVGVTFLQKDTDWINLLLNCVAMAFVVEVANNLYAQVLSQELREEVEGMDPLVVPMVGSTFLNDHPAIKDAVGFSIMIAVILLTMLLNYLTVGVPLSRALQCACISDGAHCHEAKVFNTKFWDRYWMKDVPGVFKDLDALKQTTEGGPSQAASPTDDKKGMSKDIWRNAPWQQSPWFTFKRRRAHVNNTISSISRLASRVKRRRPRRMLNGRDSRSNFADGGLEA